MISTFELFSIGVGPSSSHTVGPMRAAYEFINNALREGILEKTDRVIIDLYGSLALTGKGHGTDYAVLMGLENNLPESISPDLSQQRFSDIINYKKIKLANNKEIDFEYSKDLNFNMSKTLDFHPNGMRFKLISKDNQILSAQNYYSIGGGFIVNDDTKGNNINSTKKSCDVSYPFETAHGLMMHCIKNDKTIEEIMWENERFWRDDTQITAGLMQLWKVMDDSIAAGINHTGILPGGLNVKRRANNIYNKIKDNSESADFDWLSLYAISVNEENASWGKVVTAPTNGSAGTIPAVLKFYLQKYHNGENNEKNICKFMLTASAIGILYKKGASISAAEVGCQGEIGVASSMAAGALAACLGGTVNQIENAAEIAMEHHLGMTCDPINGLVQIPCIERNAMGAVQAVTAARLALFGNGEHCVSLDKVIATMLQTGKDMQSRYKETSQGGLAVNLPEC